MTVAIIVKKKTPKKKTTNKTLNPLTRIIARYLLVDYYSPLYTHCDVVLPTLYRNLNQLEICGVDCDFVFFKAS